MTFLVRSEGHVSAMTGPELARVAREACELADAHPRLDRQ